MTIYLYILQESVRVAATIAYKSLSKVCIQPVVVQGANAGIVVVMM